MFHNPLLFRRLQKTQILPLAGAPSAGSKTTDGANSGSVPAVSRCVAPHAVPLNRLYHIFHVPSRRERQKSQTFPALSSMAAGSVSSCAGELGSVGGAPNPSLGAAVDAVTSIATKDVSPIAEETSFIFPLSTVANPGRERLITATTSAAVAWAMLAMNVPSKLMVLVNRPSRRILRLSPPARAKGPVLAPINCADASSLPTTVRSVPLTSPSLVATGET